MRKISNPAYKPEEIVVFVSTIYDAARTFHPHRSEAVQSDKQFRFEGHFAERLAEQKKAQDAIRSLQMLSHQGSRLLGKLTNATKKQLTPDMAGPALDRMLTEVKHEELKAKADEREARQKQLEPRWQTAAQELSDFMNQLVDKYEKIATDLNANRDDINKARKALAKEMEFAKGKLSAIRQKYASDYNIRHEHTTDPIISLEIGQTYAKINTMSQVVSNYIDGMETAANEAGVRGWNGWDDDKASKLFDKKADEVFKEYSEFNLEQYKVSKEELFHSMQENFKFDEESFSAAYENQLNIHQAELKLLLIEQQKIIQHEMDNNHKTLEEARAIAAQQVNFDEVIQKIRSATLKQLRQEDNEELKAIVDTVKAQNKDMLAGYEQQKALKDETIRRYLLGDWDSKHPVSDEDRKRLDEDRVEFVNGVVAERYEGGMTFTLPEGYTEQTVDAMAAIMRNIYDITEEDQLTASPKLKSELRKGSKQPAFFDAVGLSIMSRPSPETPETKSVLKRLGEGLSKAANVVASAPGALLGAGAAAAVAVGKAAVTHRVSQSMRPFKSSN